MVRLDDYSFARLQAGALPGEPPEAPIARRSVEDAARTRYCWSYDGERFHGDCASREEAKAEAIAEAEGTDNEGCTIRTGVAVAVTFERLLSDWDVDNLIERIQEQGFDIVGEVSEVWEPTKADKADLYDRLLVTVNAWAAANKCPINFFEVADIEEHSPEMDWAKAKAHFDRARDAYQSLEGQPGVNTTLALRMVFDPLAKRFNSGERSVELYHEMLAVE